MDTAKGTRCNLLVVYQKSRQVHRPWEQHLTAQAQRKKYYPKLEKNHAHSHGYKIN